MAKPSTPNLSALWSAAMLMAGVAVAEELLFRGVLFQRLIAVLAFAAAFAIPLRTIAPPER